MAGVGGREAGDWTGDPGRNSLRLLPSGPDRVGEGPVRRQPPEGTISGFGAPAASGAGKGTASARAA